MVYEGQARFYNDLEQAGQAINERRIVMEETKKGTCYYISDKGSDTNAGTSPEAPWKTVEKVNGFVFLPGDQVLFEGGGIFEGPLIIGSESGGDPECPVLISSYGEGRAVIQGGLANGLEINGATGITVQNLNVAGPGPNINSLGVGIRPAGAHHIVIDQVEVWGFQLAGILVTEGCTHARVTHSYAHHNGYTGIGTGYRDRSKSINYDIYIGYCRASNNPGVSDQEKYIRDQTGSGINLYFAERALVEYCEACNNGFNTYHPLGNGPVGIWTAWSSYVTVQYCISHDNKSSTGDGGGFDMDSGSKHCTFQYNYSYNNNGCGYLICAYTDAEEHHRLENNTLRFCISENDGKDPGHNAGIVLYNANVQTGNVYNNIIYNQDGRSCVRIHKAHPGIRFFNNIFVMKGDGSFVDFIGSENGETFFAGNCYWKPDTGRYPEKWFDYTSLEEWRTKTSMETLEGKPTGFFADPMLSDPGRGEKLTDPTRLSELFSYLMEEDSPCLEGGINLKARFGLDMGDKDYFGNPLDKNGESFIGVQKNNL